MWVFICVLEVKTTKVDDHHFTHCTWFSDRIEERTNKEPHCTCIMYIQWLNSYLKVKSVKEIEIAFLTIRCCMANDTGIISVLKVVGNGSCRFLPLISMSVS